MNLGRFLISVSLIFWTSLASPQDTGPYAPHVVRGGSFGTWKEGTNSGSLQYFISEEGHEEVGDTLLIEWVDGKTHKVLAKVSIEPILGKMDGPRITTTEPYVLYIEISSIYCAQNQNYAITITKLGHYNLKRLNEDSCDAANGDSTN